MPAVSICSVECFGCDLYPRTVLILPNLGNYFLENGSYKRIMTLALFFLSLGSSTFPNATFGWVNVQDVAMAHVLAFELPSASGRYCLVERVVHYSEILKIIHELYPSFQLPDK